MFNHNNVPTLPYVLKPQTAQNNEYQQLMAIKRPNLNIQDKYVYMSGRIIERKPPPMAQKSPEEQYADLLEAHKTSNYIPNPLNSSDSIYGLKQAAAASAFLQNEVMRRTGVNADQNLSTLKAELLTALVSISQGLLDVQRNQNSSNNTELQQQLAVHAKNTEQVLNVLVAQGKSTSALNAFADAYLPDIVEALKSRGIIKESLLAKLKRTVVNDAKSAASDAVQSLANGIINLGTSELSRTSQEAQSIVTGSFSDTKIFNFLSTLFPSLTPDNTSWFVRSIPAAANQIPLQTQEVPNPQQIAELNDQVEQELQFIDPDTEEEMPELEANVPEPPTERPNEQETPENQDQLVPNVQQQDNSNEAGPSQLEPEIPGEIDPEYFNEWIKIQTPNVQAFVESFKKERNATERSFTNKLKEWFGDQLIDKKFGDPIPAPANLPDDTEISTIERNEFEDGDEVETVDPIPGTELVSLFKDQNTNITSDELFKKIKDKYRNLTRKSDGRLLGQYGVASRLITYGNPHLYRIEITTEIKRADHRKEFINYLKKNKAEYVIFPNAYGIYRTDFKLEGEKLVPNPTVKDDDYDRIMKLSNTKLVTSAYYTIRFDAGNFPKATTGIQNDKLREYNLREALLASIGANNKLLTDRLILDLFTAADNYREYRTLDNKVQNKPSTNVPGQGTEATDVGSSQGVVPE